MVRESGLRDVWKASRDGAILRTQTSGFPKQSVRELHGIFDGVVHVVVPEQPGASREVQIIEFG